MKKMFMLLIAALMMLAQISAGAEDTDSYDLGVGGYVFTPGGHYKYLDYNVWTEHVVTHIYDYEPAVRIISTEFIH